MSRHEIWLCMWVTLMAPKWVYLVYVGVWDSMCTLHKIAFEGVITVVYLWYELNELWLRLGMSPYTMLWSMCLMSSDNWRCYDLFSMLCIV